MKQFVKTDVFSKFLLFFIAANSIALLLSGLRLLWFNKSGLPFEYELLNIFIDQFAFDGSVLSWHLYLAKIIIILTLIYLILFSYNAYHSDNNKFEEKFFWNSGLSITGLFSIISGAAIYSGLANSSLFLKLHTILAITFSILLIVTLVINLLNYIKFSFLKDHIQILEKTGKYLVWTIIFSTSIILLLAGKMIFMTEPVLVCSHQNRSVVIDGRENDIEWMAVDEVSLKLSNGANFEAGQTEVRIKSFHNSHFIYFLVKWDDPTRSFNRHLEKTKVGWKEIKTEPNPIGGETVYYEDMMALSFHKQNRSCQQSCHLNTNSPVGNHIYNEDFADLWLWKSISTNPVDQAEDGWWGVDAIDSISNKRQTDNKAGGGYSSNLNTQWYQPYFLPGNYTMKNWIDLRSDQAILYYPELDNYLRGDKIPAMVVAPAMGDVADVRAVGRWRGGEWTVEISRVRTTGSNKDISFVETINIGISVFDNAEKKHAYHFQPVKLIIE